MNEERTFGESSIYTWEALRIRTSKAQRMFSIWQQAGNTCNVSRDQTYHGKPVFSLLQAHKLVVEKNQCGTALVELSIHL